MRVIPTLAALSDRARRFLLRRQAFRDCFLGANGELTPSGARAMRMLAKRAGVYRSSLHVSPKTGTVDPLAMAFQEGRRDIFRFLQAMLELPDREVLAAMGEEPEQ